MQELNVIQLLVVMAPPLLLAITLHEVAHGWMALRCGDTTAQAQGRLSLNPLRHIDPVGTVLVPALLAVFGGFIFGWAKPVPVDFRRLRHPKRDMALVALVGPGANMLMALGWGLILQLGQELAGWRWLSGFLFEMGKSGVYVNLFFAALNLLPIPPLDGSRVLTGLLPDRFGLMMAKIEPYGLVIILVLLVTNTLNMVLYPVVLGLNQLLSFILGY